MLLILINDSNATEHSLFAHFQMDFILISLTNIPALVPPPTFYEICFLFSKDFFDQKCIRLKMICAVNLVVAHFKIAR